MKNPSVRKRKVLKQMERYGYQVAYYLLQSEALAVEASKLALMELLEDEAFYRQDENQQRQQVKRLFIRKSLLLKVSS